MYELVRQKRRRLSCIQVRFFWGTNLLWTLFSFFLPSDRNLPGYITSRTPMQVLMITPPPACPLHIARGHTSFSMPLTQFMWHICREHDRPVYFRYQVHILLVFVFSQGQTSADASTDVKRFKSLSNWNIGNQIMNFYGKINTNDYKIKTYKIIQ